MVGKGGARSRIDLILLMTERWITRINDVEDDDNLTDDTIKNAIR